MFTFCAVEITFHRKILWLFNSFMMEAVSYGNQSIDLLRKSMDWFLYDNGLHHESFKHDLDDPFYSTD